MIRAPAAALIVALLTACDLLGLPAADVTEVSNDQLIGTPEGPVVQVSEGSADDADWTVYAFRADGGACISSRFAPFGEGGGCGPLPDAGRFGPIGIAYGETTLLLVGIVSSEVASVRLEFADGRTENAELISLERAGIDARGYGLVVPVEAPPERILAVDAAGDTQDELGMQP